MAEDVQQPIAKANQSELVEVRDAIQNVAEITDGKAPKSLEKEQEVAIQDVLATLSPAARAIAEKVLIGAKTLSAEFLRDLDNQLIGSQTLADNDAKQPGLQGNIGAGLTHNDLAVTHVDRVNLSHLTPAPTEGKGTSRDAGYTMGA